MRSLLERTLPAVATVLIWQVCAETSSRVAFLMGSPTAIAKVAVKELSGQSLYHHAFLTAAEVAVGLALGLGSGVALALLMWAMPRVQEAIEPYLNAFSHVPVFSLAPMLVFWFGVGFPAKVAVAYISCVLVCTLQAYDGISAVAPSYTRLARGLGATRSMLIRKIILPGSLSALSGTTKTTAGLALMGAFIAEFISSDAGLGHLILTATALYNMPKALVGVIVLAAVGFLLSKLAFWILRLTIQTIDSPRW